MLLFLEFPQAQRFASERRCFGGPLTISEICCLQGNSQSSVKEAKVWELANKGTVNQNQEQKITILLKIHNKASYDQAVQDMYDPRVCDVSEVLQGRGLSEVRTEKSYSVNKADTRSTANEAGRNAHLTGERSPVY
jgi:hypothetical protein